MPNERNSLKAGIFIIISMALVVAIVIGIKGVGRFLEPTQRATVSFTLTDDIGGLSPGDEVRIGGAKVSEIHGNFIVNDQKATARDVLSLIEKVKETALRERGITLETEVQIVGEEGGFHD